MKQQNISLFSIGNKNTKIFLHLIGEAYFKKKLTDQQMYFLDRLANKVLALSACKIPGQLDKNKCLLSFWITKKCDALFPYLDKDAIAVILDNINGMIISLQYFDLSSFEDLNRHLQKQKKTCFAKIFQPTPLLPTPNTPCKSPHQLTLKI